MLVGVSGGGETDQVHARATATSQRVSAAISSEDLAFVGRFLGDLGIDRDEIARLIDRYPVDALVRTRVQGLKDACGDSTATAFERFLLLRAAERVLGSIVDLPVACSVKTLFCEEFEFFAAPDKRRAPLLTLGTPTFSASCELVSLRRFPAGQLHWNVSGLPRRMLARIPVRDLPRTLRFVATKMKGFSPTFFSHVNGLRRNRFVWLEEESNRAYARMAESLHYQPRILGLVTMSWFHDPGISEVSPHLAWTNRVILENGGLVVSAGLASVSEGAIENNRERQVAYEKREYSPRLGLVLWPRDAMLGWLARHPELRDRGNATAL
jgi:hypothetical protein